MRNSMFDLKGKVALIAGGNSGPGLGYAAGLVKGGADIIIWGRQSSDLTLAYL